MLDLVLDVSVAKTRLAEDSAITRSQFEVASVSERPPTEVITSMPEEARAFVAQVKCKNRQPKVDEVVSAVGLAQSDAAAEEEFERDEPGRYGGEGGLIPVMSFGPQLPGAVV
eukprot:scaffold212826_cov33-Prasinocladus_malaysianus.AAC.1